MKFISFADSRASFAETLDAAVHDREEVVITRAGHEPVVLVSLGLRVPQGNAYLLRSPENARRLLTAIERLEADSEMPHELAE